MDGQTLTGPSVQRNIPPPTGGGWFGQQMSDLKDLVSDPGFLAGTAATVGLLLALPLFLPAAVAAGIALVLGGIVGGLISALSSGAGLLKSALIGGLVGLAFFLGAAALSALGLTGLVLLAGVMLLGALIGIIVNLATGQRWDKGLLANLLLAGLLHKFSRWVSGKRAAGTDPSNSTQQPKANDPVTKRGGPDAAPDEPVAKRDGPESKRDEPESKRDEPESKRDEPAKERDREEQKAPPAMSALKKTVVGRAEVLADNIRLLRERLGNTSKPTPKLAQELERDALAARDILNKADNATTDAKLTQLSGKLDALEAKNYDREIGVRHAETADWVISAERRVAALRERIPPKNKPRPPDPTKPGANRPDPAALSKGLSDAERAVRDLRREYEAASSDTALEAIKKEAGKLEVKLKELEMTNDALLLPPTLESAGVSPAAAEAIRLVDLKERDPLGDLHRAPADDKHFGAARREAKGEKVATKPLDASGKPWAHVNEIQNARNAVFGAREAIIKELEQQRRDLTPYGRSKLQEQATKATKMINEVDQFLNEIGWPADRPFQWVQQHGEWVPAADVNQMREAAVGRLNDLATELTKKATTDTINEVRSIDPAQASALETRRAALEADVTNEQTAAQTAQTEAQVTTLQQAIEQLQRIWKDLYNDIHLSRVPK